MPGPNDDKPYCGPCPHGRCLRGLEDCTIFTCKGCGQEMPSCFGCDDADLDLCDMCWHDKEHGEATGTDEHGNPTFDDGSVLMHFRPKRELRLECES